MAGEGASHVQSDDEVGRRDEVNISSPQNIISLTPSLLHVVDENKI